MPIYRAHHVQLNRAGALAPHLEDLYDLRYQQGLDSVFVLHRNVHIPSQLRFWFDEAQRYPYADFAFEMVPLADDHLLRRYLPGAPKHLVTGIKFGAHLERADAAPVKQARLAATALAVVSAVACVPLVFSTPGWALAALATTLGALVMHQLLPRSSFAPTPAYQGQR